MVAELGLVESELSKNKMYGHGRMEVSGITKVGTMVNQTIMVVLKIMFWQIGMVEECGTTSQKDQSMILFVKQMMEVYKKGMNGITSQFIHERNWENWINIPIFYSFDFKNCLWTFSLSGGGVE